jgi:2-dehydro-3-deoxyphosphogluconate aldolase/(4S)-4-hydroxy-2-oxoglutarate aldolase
VKQAEAAVAAGAKYLLAPNFDPEVVAAAQRLGVASIPGALTPSEIAAAWRAGATLVKLFPIGNFGSAYVKAITAPLSHIPLLGMGGINRQNMLEYLSLPSLVGVGIGSNLAPVSLIQSGDYIGLTKLAKSYTSLLA